MTKIEMGGWLEDHLRVLEKGRKAGVGLREEHDQVIVTGWKAEHLHMMRVNAYMQGWVLVRFFF